MTIETPRQDIVPIQMLRGIAALMVVFVHLDIQLKRLGYQALDSGWGVTGVDIFFVISGFIMWISVERRDGMTAAQFMRNRIIRIVPLYWLVTSFVLGVLLFAPHLLRTTAFEPWHTISSYLFLPARHPLTNEWWPLLVPGWTLNYEMLFYLLFAIAIFVAKGSANIRFAVIAALILGWMAMAYGFASAFDPLSFYAKPQMIEFLAGIMLAIVFRSRKVPLSRWWMLLVVAGFAALFFAFRIGPVGSLLVPLGSTAIVAGALFAPMPTFAALKRLGDGSYSLYLTHVITLAAMSVAWSKAGLYHVPASMFILVAVVACIIVADLSFRLVEIPATRYLKQRFPSVREPASRPATAVESS